jgi:methionine synthase II (cobalamin-independent)
MASAASLRAEIEALSAAGCPLVEIEESEAHRIGTDDAERQLFREAHHVLVDAVTGTHLSLSIVGGAANEAGLETILDAPYASLAVDLIAGPDNWHLVTPLGGDRGVIVGAESARAVDEPKEVLLWAAHYAASTRGRGHDRVGIGSAGSYANLTWEAAVRKMRILGEAARLATLPPSAELARELDPRALDARRAAMGHDAGRRSRRQTEE